jgi:hypothetical protein
MTKPWKKTLLCFAFTVIFVALLMQRAAFAGALTFGREKLKGTTTSQGDYSVTHPNLADAQTLTAQAYDKVSTAQGNGEWDAAGHAKKAQALLSQAQNELKLAAEVPNRK